jgi:hypothetical protein
MRPRSRQWPQYRCRYLGLRGPGVGDDQPGSIGDLGTDIHAILGAGDQTIQQAQVAKRDGGARLERDNAVQAVIGGVQELCYMERGSVSVLIWMRAFRASARIGAQILRCAKEACSG